MNYVDVYIISNIGDIPWFHWEEAILIESSMVEEDDDEGVQAFTIRPPGPAWAYIVGTCTCTSLTNYVKALSIL